VDRENFNFTFYLLHGSIIKMPVNVKKKHRTKYPKFLFSTFDKEDEK
jgi:hypothetical protein